MIPARNSAATLAATLRSVAAQVSEPDEVVVVDDGSGDTSAEVAAAAGVTLLRSDGCGAAAARNRGLETLTADYAAFLDADDMWPSDYIEIVRRSLRGSAPGFLAAGCRRITPEGGPCGTRRPAVASLDPVSLLRRNVVTTSGTVVAVDAVRSVGGFDEGVRHCEDLDLWVRVLASGVSCDTVPSLVWYLVREDPEPLAKVRDVEANRRLVLVRAARSLDLPPRLVADLERRMVTDVGTRYLKSGHHKDARRCFREGMPSTVAVVGLASLVLPRSVRDTARRLLRAGRRRVTPA